jgi:periplasmic divalent cation tolerance protein
MFVPGRSDFRRMNRGKPAMNNQISNAIVVLMTAGSREEAARLAEMLVNSRLAACVQIMPEMESVFFWKDKVERQPETLLIAKTTEANFDELQREIIALHSYETPEIIAVPISAISAPYLEWLTSTVKSSSHIDVAVNSKSA